MADMAWEPDYVTLPEFKTWARIEAEDNEDNDAISRAITAASRSIDEYCSRNVPRQFGRVTLPEPRYYTPRWDSRLIRWVIEIDDLMDLTDLEILIDTTNNDNYNQEITDYALRPKNALAEGRPYTQIVIANTSRIQPTYFKDSARITAPWGWTEFPTTVVAATLLQTNRIHKSRVTPFRETGSSQRGTQLTKNKIQHEIDEDIALMLKTYVKAGWTM